MTVNWKKGVRECIEIGMTYVVTSVLMMKQEGHIGVVHLVTCFIHLIILLIDITEITNSD